MSQEQVTKKENTETIHIKTHWEDFLPIKAKNALNAKYNMGEYIIPKSDKNLALFVAFTKNIRDKWHYEHIKDECIKLGYNPKNANIQESEIIARNILKINPEEVKAYRIYNTQTTKKITTTTEYIQNGERMTIKLIKDNNTLGIPSKFISTGDPENKKITLNGKDWAKQNINEPLKIETKEGTIDFTNKTGKQEIKELLYLIEMQLEIKIKNKVDVPAYTTIEEDSPQKKGDITIVGIHKRDKDAFISDEIEPTNIKISHEINTKENLNNLNKDMIPIETIIQADPRYKLGTKKAEEGVRITSKTHEETWKEKTKIYKSVAGALRDQYMINRANGDNINLKIKDGKYTTIKDGKEINFENSKHALLHARKNNVKIEINKIKREQVIKQEEPAPKIKM